VCGYQCAMMFCASQHPLVALFCVGRYTPRKRREVLAVVSCMPAVVLPRRAVASSSIHAATAVKVGNGCQRPPCPSLEGQQPQWMRRSTALSEVKRFVSLVARQVGKLHHLFEFGSAQLSCLSSVNEVSREANVVCHLRKPAVSPSVAGFPYSTVRSAVQSWSGCRCVVVVGLHLREFIGQSSAPWLCLICAAHGITSCPVR